MKYIIIALIIGILSSIPIVAYGAITLDNSNRREYTYCPITDNLAKSLNAEIDGCPLVRVYVNNWNTLTSLQQTTIDSQLRGLGFVDAGEHIIRW